MPNLVCVSCGSDGLDGHPRAAVSTATGEVLCSVCEVAVWRVLWGILDRWNRGSSCLPA